MVELTGRPLLVLVAVLAVVFPLLVTVLWTRAVRSEKRPAGVVRTVGRLLALVLCQALALLLAFLVLNNSYGFYTSWDDLLGIETDGTVNIESQGLKAAGGELRTVEVKGGPSGAEGEVLVWLPPQYAMAEHANTKFPVLLFLPGQPATVASTFEGFDFGNTATHQINSGHVQPFIAIFAPLMTNPPRDTECTDIPNGPKAFTWLAEDMRQWAISSLRASDDPELWSVMGWSTGGFCAAKLILRAPDKFTNAAALGAYFEPIIDDTTGDLFESDQNLQNENSPLYLYRHGGLARGHNLLMVSSRQDDASWEMTDTMMTATKGNGNVYTLIYPSGGHNYDTYSQALIPTLVWFDQFGAFAGQGR